MKTWELNLTFVVKVARTFVSVLCPNLLLGRASPQCPRVDTYFINVLNLASPQAAAPALNCLHKQSSEIIYYSKKAAYSVPWTQACFALWRLLSHGYLVSVHQLGKQEVC